LVFDFLVDKLFVFKQSLEAAHMLDQGNYVHLFLGELFATIDELTLFGRLYFANPT
jgi:hypothetical protein